MEEWGDLGLAAIAIVLSLVATQAAPALALPLFAGGFVAALLGCRAVFRRWDLFERLLLDPTAYAIPEIRSRAEEKAGKARRAAFARSIRAMLDLAPPYRNARVELVAAELAGLADDLDDDTLRLDALCAVRCERLLRDGAESPLLNTAVPADGLRIAIVLIRAGFEPRED